MTYRTEHTVGYTFSTDGGLYKDGKLLGMYRTMAQAKAAAKQLEKRQ